MFIYTLKLIINDFSKVYIYRIQIIKVGKTITIINNNKIK